MELQPWVMAVSSTCVATIGVATYLLHRDRGRPKLRVRIRGPDQDGRIVSLVTNLGEKSVLIESCGFDLGDQRVLVTGITLPRKLEASDFYSFDFGSADFHQLPRGSRVTGAWVRTAEGKEFHSRDTPRARPPWGKLAAALGTWLPTGQSRARAITTAYAVAIGFWLWSLQPCVPLVVVSSNEKASLLGYLARQFNNRPTLGECVRVEVHRLPSGEAQAALVADWNLDRPPRPDVWTPAATSWAMLLRQERGPARDIVPVDIPKIAASPLVVGMPRPMAERLGWPEQKTWEEIFSLAGTSWGAYGRAEFGSFRLVMTEPSVSTSGLHARIAEYFVATDRWNPSCAEVTRPDVTAQVGEIERKVAGRRETIRGVLEELYRIDQRDREPTRAVIQISAFLSAVPIEEAQLWQYNNGNPQFAWTDPEDEPKRTPPTVPLVAFYPTDSTLMADHPYIILEARWVDDRKRAAARRFLSFLRDHRDLFLVAGFRDEQGRLHPGRGLQDGLLVDGPRNPQDVPTPERVKCIRDTRVSRRE